MAGFILLQIRKSKLKKIFAAGRVSLGSLGILTQITMQNRPRYKLREHIELCPVEDMMQTSSNGNISIGYIEVLFSYEKQLMLKTLDETDEDFATQGKFPLDDTLLTMCSELTKFSPH